MSSIMHNASSFDYIASLSKQHAQAWYCATGNGLAAHFKHIEASDISQGKIAKAFAQANIHFSVQAAEQTTFTANQFDLVNVAQALHWLTLKNFGPK
jgi:ubiquinone/menaquinone biosynthesis C-methylase UbiE